MIIKKKKKKKKKKTKRRIKIINKLFLGHLLILVDSTHKKVNKKPNSNRRNWNKTKKTPIPPPQQLQNKIKPPHY